MDKKIIFFMGLPMEMKNIAGSKATIELNVADFVACSYGRNNSVYINNAKLENWHPTNWLKRMTYELKIRLKRNDLV